MLPPLFTRLSNRLLNSESRIDVRKSYAAELAYGRWRGPAPSDAKAAAVLILIHGDPLLAHPIESPLDHWHLPLTVRAECLSRHGGQIALPGGALQPGENEWQAAIRESEEELGVCLADAIQLGKLSPSYVLVSNYLVTPHVAFLPSNPVWKRQVSEVAEIFELPLQFLINPKNLQVPLQESHGFTFKSPAICFNKYQIWGATMLILGELITLIQESIAEKESR